MEWSSIDVPEGNKRSLLSGLLVLVLLLLLLLLLLVVLVLGLLRVLRVPLQGGVEAGVGEARHHRVLVRCPSPRGCIRRTGAHGKGHRNPVSPSEWRSVGRLLELAYRRRRRAKIGAARAGDRLVTHFAYGAALTSSIDTCLLGSNA